MSDASCRRAGFPTTQFGPVLPSPATAQAHAMLQLAALKHQMGNITAAQKLVVRFLQVMMPRADLCHL